ncbi:hypothetical protein GALL_247630 [mine drainage metagenome]|jgi:hypothetical protein|uniref:Uncharacterized protein n=1 Tax=mine drainage metagenome TaxID=410659 RepID=A0A1J5RBS2_9ZZZZ
MADPAPPVRGMQGRQALRGGDSPQGFPPEASEARSARRREGVRDWSRMAVTAKSAWGAARKARRGKTPARPAILAPEDCNVQEATRHGRVQKMVSPP